MPTDRARRLSPHDYATYVARGAAASSAAQVERLRTQLLERWRGDPRAEDLADVLYAHQQQLAAREHTLRLEAGRVRRRLESRLVQRTS
jgi:hypothetical protein